MAALGIVMTAYILPVCALLAPGGTGASTPRRWHIYFDQGPKKRATDLWDPTPETGALQA